MAVKVTPITGNVNKGGTFTSVPDDTPPAKYGALPQGKKQYYTATDQGGDPSWPAVRKDVKPPLTGQNNYTVVQVLLETDANVSTCVWEIYNLKESTVGGAVADPMAMTAFVARKATDPLGKRPGRQLLVDDGSGKYAVQPLYQDYPVPVFKRANGPRVVVDFPIPQGRSLAAGKKETFDFVIDLIEPGKAPVKVGSVTIDRDDKGVVTIATTPKSGGGSGTSPTGVAPGTPAPAPGGATGGATGGNPGPSGVPGASDAPDGPDGADVTLDVPTSSSTKQEIVDYLLGQGAAEEDLAGLTKADLLDLV